ncbi:hypothetical protein K435DRAFT_197667 [Dendrothele bispora CBS 962.96]|uniref:Uncharacterized protein n=1 Tax=Dendrothele bispora (strain CBS 962.96) TaxID=1314807 RepID=A0A4S8KKN7_DENBC|nr:hypothetical protein K435DRAFT_197667 [Dendrothele bispora CBS 962.96]
MSSNSMSRTRSGFATAIRIFTTFSAGCLRMTVSGDEGKYTVANLQASFPSPVPARQF